MVNGFNLTEQQAAALARIELCRLALAILVINAGGQIKITNEDLDKQPLGHLQVGWNGKENLEVRYTPHNHAQPLRDEGLLSLAILVHKAGGRLIIKGADADKMPNGTLGHIIDDDGIQWLYAQRQEPKPSGVH